MTPAQKPAQGGCFRPALCPILRTLAVLAAIVLADAGAAQDQPLHIRNAGALDCSRVSAMYGAAGNEIDKTAVLHWLGGYATAQSELRGVIDVFPLADTGEFVQMVVLICSESPGARLREAAAAAVTRLRPLWVAGAADTIRIEDGTGVSVMFRAAVAPLQELLVKKGATLAVDGAYGARTGTAVQSLHASIGTATTQRPTGIALYVLTRP